MEIKTFPLGPLETNGYLLSHEGKGVFIDPGGDPAQVLDYAEKNGITIETILLTHLHFDHVYGCKALKKATGAPVYAHEGDRVLAGTEVGDGGMMGLPTVNPFDFEDIGPGNHTFSGLPCKVFHTPGHSLGSLVYYFPDAQAAFVGDLIFFRSIGRTDFPGGSMDVLKDSVEKNVFILPEETALYPGHGPSTSVGDEKNHNPFFSEY